MPAKRNRSRSARKTRRQRRSSRRRREVGQKQYWWDEEEGDYSSRRQGNVHKPKRRRQYIPAQIFTFVGMGLPVGYLLPWRLDALDTDTKSETTGLCVASLAGSTWLTIAMSFYEGEWCNSSLMLYSWLLFALILVANALIIVVELTDSFEDYTAEGGEETDTKWISLGFACSAILVVSSFIFNVVYIYKCVGQKSPQEDKYNSNATRNRRRTLTGYTSEGFVTRRSRGSTGRNRRRSKYSYSEDEKRLRSSTRVNEASKRTRIRQKNLTEIQPRRTDPKFSIWKSGNNGLVTHRERSREKKPTMEITPAQKFSTLREERGPGSR